MAFITVEHGGEKKVIFIGDQQGAGQSPGVKAGHATVVKNMEGQTQEGVKAGHATVVKKLEALAEAKKEEGIQAGNAHVVKSGSLPNASDIPDGSGAVHAGHALVVPSKPSWTSIEGTLAGIK